LLAGRRSGRKTAGLSLFDPSEPFAIGRIKSSKQVEQYPWVSTTKWSLHRQI
jgi:hypothetical protein